MKTAPNDSLALSAPAMVAEALDKELNTRSAATSTAAPPVNDLTSAVKRKKKAPEKRKAENEAESEKTDKKVKLDSSDP